MATVDHKNFVLRNISGRLGGFVVRQRNGKTIISARPNKFTVPQTPECAARRDKFKSVLRFATCLNKIPPISAIWKAAKIKGTFARNRLVKYNYEHFDQNKPTLNNLITPDEYHFKIEELILVEDHIGIIFEERLEFDENDMLILIMALFDPADSMTNDFELMDLSPGDASDFTIKLNEAQLNLCKMYKSFILYAAVYRQTEDKLEWSNTRAAAGELEF